MSRRDEDAAVLEEAHAIEASDVPARALLARLISRTEHGIRVADATREAVTACLVRVQRIEEAQAEDSERTGRLLGAVARLEVVVGEPPGPRTAGRGIALLVATLWSERRGAAVGALVGSGGAVGLLELARQIVEALR